MFYIYFGFAALLQGVIYVVDAGLFAFWNFKIDATIFNYLDSPAEVVASVSTTYVVVGVLSIIAVVVGIFLLYKITLTARMAERLAALRLGMMKRILGTIVHLVWGGLLFLCIRGGTDVSTAYPGMVNFTDNAY